MLNRIIAASLQNRALVVAAAVMLLLYGGYRTMKLPIDVFPDLNRPSVTIMTEAHGLAPEEVETLVTFPIESAMNGATGVQRVRSASGIGLSIVWVEFEWGSDIYIDRQVVAEKLQLVRPILPDETNPVMTPITSIMGEIMLIGLQSDGDTSPLELRTIADWTIRRRLLAISGISQVTVMGGQLKQYQVLTSPERLAKYDVTLDQLARAVEQSNVAVGGGFLLDKQKESLIRILGRATTLDDIRQTVVDPSPPIPVTIGDIAEVALAGPVKRGDGSVNGEAAAILSVQKQPGADTLTLTAEIDRMLDGIQDTLPNDIRIERHVFRQSDFIEVAIDNVLEAIRDGAIWVVVVIFFFLWNFRTSTITLTAIPLSVIITALAFDYFGITINTMTLGGLAVAIGELVDDSIVDIENIFRRLKENRQKETPDHQLKVIYLASCEIRNSVLYATLIVVLVVFPLFSLPGLEGRMFAPLGLAYLTTLLASLVVSLTVTPVLASLLLPKAGFIERRKDAFLLRAIKWIDVRVLRFTLKHSTFVLTVVAALVLVSASFIFWMGGEFLPPFNEGTLTIGMRTPPATALEESNRVGTIVEEMLLDIPEVTHVSRRTGRAELDEHAENVNMSDIEVGLLEPLQSRPGFFFAVCRAIPGLHRVGYERAGRPREDVLDDIRSSMAEIPGVQINIGQPISHRLDHIMSGIRSQIAVKVFGEDLNLLRAKAEEVFHIMEDVEGVVDLQIEQQVDIPQVRVTILRDEAATYGLTPAQVAKALETAFQGHTVSQVLEGQRTFDLVVWFDEEARNDVQVIQSTLLSTPSGARIRLGTVAQVIETSGPNTINRENVLRRIAVQANVANRDLVSVVQDIQSVVNDKVVPTLPNGYFVQFGGQFRAQQQANLRLLLLGTVSVIGVFLLLLKCLNSWQAALQVMVNIPLAAIGSVLALLLTSWPEFDTFGGEPFWQWPKVWIESISLSVAHWVGFITLIGIVSRNGILMISHYIHLMQREGEEFGEQMIIRGSLERIAPVMMTALTTIIGLLPLALGAGQTGKEILHPLAIVVIGGLISATLLDQLVTPALFYKFGRKVYERAGDEQDNDWMK